MGHTSIMRFVAPWLWEQTPPLQAPCLARGGVGDRRPAHGEDGDHQASCLLAALGAWLCGRCPDLPPGLALQASMPSHVRPPYASRLVTDR